MHVQVIGNPIAGRGSAQRKIDEFVRVLERRGHRVEVAMTSCPGHAFSLARSLSSGIDRLVAAGGDGTINEVINGLHDPSLVPILHLPAGTANQLAKSLGLPFDARRLARVLEEGEVRRIDMGMASDRRFLMLASAGFDAKVTEEVRTRRNGTLGYAAYAVPVIKTLAGHRPTLLNVVLDGERCLSCYMVMVLKVRRYGGVLAFAEDASLDSGYFSVCAFPHAGRLSLFAYAGAGLVPKLAPAAGVIKLQARSVRIESECPSPVEVDGDFLGLTPVNIRIVPGAAAVVAPRRSRHWSRSVQP